MLKCRKLLKLNYDRIILLYCRYKGLLYDNLQYLGKGDNGLAYLIDGKVLKLTTSISLVFYNNKLFTSDLKFSYIALVYDVMKLDYRYAILKLFIHLSQKVEDVFYILSSLLIDVSLLGTFDVLDVLDLDLKSLYYESLDYIDQLRHMYDLCKWLGVQVPDISPLNVGKMKNGGLKLMDLDLKRNHNKTYDIKGIPTLDGFI